MKIKGLRLFLWVLVGSLVVAGCQKKVKESKLKTGEPQAEGGLKAPNGITDQLKRSTVFMATVDGINSYRIPSLISDREGKIIVFAEGRKESWRDKSPTDIVLKTSDDQGETWSEMKVILDGGKDAFMDPVAVLDQSTGRIFLFVTHWPSEDHSMKSNTFWMLFSDDSGETWSEPENLTKSLIPEQHWINGTGPGTGIQLSDKREEFADRLMVPIRLFDGTKIRNAGLFSDDHGATWTVGETMTDGEEFQIAESPKGRLVSNMRADGRRLVSHSEDGGVSWSPYQLEKSLKTTKGGVEASIFGKDSLLLYIGPIGPKHLDSLPANIDNRSNLSLFKSKDAGETWGKEQILYTKASGYTAVVELKDGRLGIVFESADTPGFIRDAERGYNWMRIDFMALPKAVLE